ncbi:hypothetical protein D8I35_14555 [Corticibacter populi]|uniref:DegT/DnrJ/EryC1/StrS aminotransferase n=1 Tax=Corticibacter populi TaxID=1550736 RepID=A0A3M6QM68_9BURK|nr:DegT/DnrJ/EryC1/StrS family aminotransferase [Corticibacter populi]RMX04045.1 hypothetical protein D8I35_14555 [Corticibacter populi]RZS33045.1 dTDP-4-amino-4,6-dideoxygalactose transaminase [Corticibacter populi]
MLDANVREQLLRGKSTEGGIQPFSPLLPRAHSLLPYLELIDENRWYSNRGLLTCHLESRIAQMLGPSVQVAATSCGQAAIEAAILAFAGMASIDRPYALLPSYTFSATASAVQRCGYTPYFVDIEADDWLLSADALLNHPMIGKAGLVVAVCAYGRRIEQAPWVLFKEKTGVPVVIDAAAAFESISQSPQELLGTIPVAISLQATKTLSSGEGGLVIGTTPDLYIKVAQATNFGFFGSRETTAPGFNGKLSEYHAAVGLASLDEWASTQKAWCAVHAEYQRLAMNRGVQELLFASPGVASCYVLFRSPSDEAVIRIVRSLEHNRIECRHWYGRGLHSHQYYASCPKDELPNTTLISGCLIGLPVAIDLSEVKMARILDAIVAAL